MKVDSKKVRDDSKKELKLMKKIEEVNKMFYMME